MRSPLLRTLTGDTGWVTAVAVSADNRWIVSGSNGGDAIKVWDFATGKASVGCISRASYTIF